jgi:quinoprotein glucose dehydrogenase
MAWIVALERIDPDIHRGEAIFRLNCVRCHGNAPLDAQAASEDQGRVAVAAGPSLANVGERLSPDSIAQVVRAGRAAMPAHPQFTDAELSDLVDHLLESAERPATTVGEGGMPYGSSVLVRFLDRRGRPVVEPPWGTLSAIDLDTGETLWQVPLGDDEDVVDPEHPVTGTENYGGPVVTAGGLVFIAATRDEKIRAFHARTGEQLWEARLPAGGYATPATYEVDGRQYLVIACGGGKMGTPSGDRYVAFALPAAPT